MLQREPKKSLPPGHMLGLRMKSTMLEAAFRENSSCPMGDLQQVQRYS